VAEDEGDVSFVAEISEPVPAEGGLAADDESFAIRRECKVEFINAAGQFPVQEFVPRVIEDAEVKCSGMKVDSGIECVGILVKSHHGLLCEVVE
jgi:hypothetical protein